MTKSILAEKISERLQGLTKKQMAAIINTIFEKMKEVLGKGEKIEIRGFGNFRLKNRRARIARNPKTGEKVAVSSRKTVHFKIGKAFHNALNKN